MRGDDVEHEKLKERLVAGWRAWLVKERGTTSKGSENCGKAGTHP
jgi:hypothetical protein